MSSPSQQQQQQGGGGEGSLALPSALPRLDPVQSYLRDDSQLHGGMGGGMGGTLGDDFPVRAYSVGSKPAPSQHYLGMCCYTLTALPRYVLLYPNSTT